ncbi:hypothetical protein C8J57DRAFT_1478000, partial [Mycena rebaudengoi]
MRQQHWLHPPQLLRLPACARARVTPCPPLRAPETHTLSPLAQLRSHHRRAGPHPRRRSLRPPVPNLVSSLRALHPTHRACSAARLRSMVHVRNREEVSRGRLRAACGARSAVFFARWPRRRRKCYERSPLNRGGGDGQGRWGAYTGQCGRSGRPVYGHAGTVPRARPSHTLPPQRPRRVGCRVQLPRPPGAMQRALRQTDSAELVLRPFLFHRARLDLRCAGRCAWVAL